MTNKLSLYEVRDIFSKVMEKENFGDVILEIHMKLREMLMNYEYTGNLDYFQIENNSGTIESIIFNNTKKKFKFRLKKNNITQVENFETKEIQSINYYLFGGRSYMVLNDYIKDFVKKTFKKDLDFNFTDYSPLSTDYDFELNGLELIFTDKNGIEHSVLNKDFSQDEILLNEMIEELDDDYSADALQNLPKKEYDTFISSNINTTSLDEDFSIIKKGLFKNLYDEDKKRLFNDFYTHFPMNDVQNLSIFKDLHTKMISVIKEYCKENKDKLTKIVTKLKDEEGIEIVNPKDALDFQKFLKDEDIIFQLTDFFFCKQDYDLSDCRLNLEIVVKYKNNKLNDHIMENITQFSYFYSNDKIDFIKKINTVIYNLKWGNKNINIFKSKNLLFGPPRDGQVGALRRRYNEHKDNNKAIEYYNNIKNLSDKKKQKRSALKVENKRLQFKCKMDYGRIEFLLTLIQFLEDSLQDFPELKDNLKTTILIDLDKLISLEYKSDFQNFKPIDILKLIEKSFAICVKLREKDY